MLDRRRSRRCIRLLPLLLALVRVYAAVRGIIGAVTAQRPPRLSVRRRRPTWRAQRRLTREWRPAVLSYGRADPDDVAADGDSAASDHVLPRSAPDTAPYHGRGARRAHEYVATHH